MASIFHFAWAPPPTNSIAAASSSTSPKPAFAPPPKRARGRRRGAALAARASLSESPEAAPSEEPEVPNRVKLAFARAKAYRKEKSLRAAPEENPVRGGGPVVGGGDSSGEVPDSVKIALERAREYKKETGAVAKPVGASAGSRGDDSIVPKSIGAVEEAIGASEGSGEVGGAVPEYVKLAMQRAREYKKNRGAVGGEGDVVTKQPSSTGLEKPNMGNPESMVVDNKSQKPGELKVSSLDFLGFDFSEKKNRGVPAGLIPVADTFSDGDFPEVEIIVGDASKFGSSAPSNINLNEADENVGLYKPKVSTWGVFPRPSNISKTFGGGKNIRPGEVLETAEVKAAKEEQTRQLTASYKSKMGITIDAKLKTECEMVLVKGISTVLSV